MAPCRDGHLVRSGTNQPNDNIQIEIHQRTLNFGSGQTAFPFSFRDTSQRLLVNYAIVNGMDGNYAGGRESDPMRDGKRWWHSRRRTGTTGLPPNDTVQMGRTPRNNHTQSERSTIELPSVQIFLRPTDAPNQDLFLVDRSVLSKYFDFRWIVCAHVMNESSISGETRT